MARRSSVPFAAAGVVGLAAVGWLAWKATGRRLRPGSQAEGEPVAPAFIELPAPDGAEPPGGDHDPGEVVAAARAEA